MQIYIFSYLLVDMLYIIVIVKTNLYVSDKFIAFLLCFGKYRVWIICQLFMKYVFF